LESSAQAALITRQNELWAYAGQLSRDAAQELAQSIQRYWDSENESDLLRFVRLQSTEAQHMLYARKLSANMILALVFDAETPFSTIRSQAGKLVKNLSESAFGETAQTPVTEDAPPVAVPDFTSVEEGEYEEDLPPISELLGDVPPPIPPKYTPVPKISLPWEQKPAAQEVAEHAATREAAPKPVREIQKQNSSSFSRESSPAIRRDSIKRPIPALDETFAGKSIETETGNQAETHATEVPDDMALTRKHEVRNDPEAVIETRPQVVAESVTEVAHRILLEPASPALVNLTYACLLIPRFDHHHLVGDFVDRLNEWVPQVCVAFGWRLEHISVRPEYLQWVTRVPPSTAPGYIMRIIRQQTSDRIFAEFPRYKIENPSGDFWAPGYLIMGSSQPHPQKLVRDFIKQTRTRQGLGY
jgi:REP element-mobilizing transposase RayT